MEWNANLLDFLQKLTYNLVDYISDKDYMEFVRESLKLSSQALDNKSEIFFMIDWKIWMSMVF